MSILKIKSIGLLAASVLFSSQEAIAEDHWGAGIKASGSISFMKESAKMTKEIEDVKKSGIDVSTNYFNPWFGAGIYAEYAFFNDHIGVGTEILYNRFIGSFSRSSKPNSAVAPNISDTDTGTDTIRTDTIAFPLTFGVYWTSFIRPSF
ncbi:hypothetical protein [Cardinium endosymbiont of Culicoides punctatus]|uniref:hypothetical protein n=1 Tax=Cardinium endosymbiont of Culicoides punctatus TaxID=2304601 RepID=UPI001058F2CB|nr:hypothetical protein [Cardinium endosymbiont of Culicoides punctatus]TDG93364.1 hypothetical protein CCPUN_08850 [Cardinium endosymbiont of Culicoides punctatus]